MACSIDGCQREVNSRTWCKMHYERWRRHGDPTPQAFRQMGNDDARLWSKVDVGHPLGCWLWTAGKTAAGYGTIRHSGKNRLAHRVAFEALRGPIPEGLQIDHLCRVRHCVNPDHLEPVTLAENVRRGHGGGPRARSGGSQLATRTHCKSGHELSGANVQIQGNTRICRECRKQRARAFRARQEGQRG